MTALRRVLVVGVLVSWAALAGGCDLEGPRPFQAPAPSPVETGPGALRVEGPDHVPPRTTAELTAWLTRPGMPREDVTRRVKWLSTEPSVMTVDADGVLSALAIGEAVIHAVLGEQIVGHAVRAVPDGTYELSGSVLPFGPNLRARIEVTGGVGPPVATETAETGSYRILGVGGRVRMTVRMQGFATRTVDLDVAGDTRHNLQMTGDGAERLWRLTIIPSCMNSPGMASTTLTADVALGVSDSAAMLLPAEQPELAFFGELSSGALLLRLGVRLDGWSGYESPGLRMRSTSDGNVEALGELHLTREGDGYSGHFEGALSAYPWVDCYGEGHVATLRER